MTRHCPICNEPFANGDYLVDHLTDTHHAFDYIVDGRPMPEEYQA